MEPIFQRTIPDIFSPLPAGAVRLRGGLARVIRASIDGWILGNVPYHDFSRIFREGRPKYATGEMWGKFVRSGCMMFRAFPDPAIRERMRERPQKCYLQATSGRRRKG